MKCLYDIDLSDIDRGLISDIPSKNHWFSSGDLEVQGGETQNVGSKHEDFRLDSTERLVG